MTGSKKIMRSLSENSKAVIDLGVVLMIVTAFVGLIVISYIIYQVQLSLNPTGNALATMNNITTGYNNAISLILVAVTIFILALAISALLLLRQRQA
jgi:membrane-anchored glycerophosphoryl diester phosphodiesterase (GDPDase)